jgi:hypothetical protein
VLAGLLRVGIALDRSHALHVHDVQCEITPTNVTVQPMIHSEVDASLEVYTANQRVDLLSDALARTIVIANPVITGPRPT